MVTALRNRPVLKPVTTAMTKARQTTASKLFMAEYLCLFPVSLRGQ